MASTTLPKPGPPPTAPPGQFRAPEPVIATIEALCSEAEIPKPSHTDAAISKSSFMLSSLTGLQEEFHAPTVVPSEVGKMFPSVDTPNIDGMFASAAAVENLRFPSLDGPPTAIASAVATYKQQRPNVESPGRGEAGAMASTTLPKPGPPPTAPPGQFRAPEPVIATIEALCSEAEIPKPSHTDAAISKSSFMLSSLTGLQEEFHAPTVVPSEVGKMFPSVDTPNIDGMFASAAAVENLRFPSLDGLAEQLKAPEPITASFMTRSSKRTGARRSGSCPPQSSSPMASHPIRGSSQSPSARIQTSEEVPLRWLRKWCAQQTGMHHCFSIQGKSKHFD